MSQTAVKDQQATKTGSDIDVELRKVFKVFNGETAVRGVDLSIHRGEFFSILGPSGCGKTTMLRLIAGFEDPTAGEVLIRGQSVINVPPYRRPVNTVFQSYALFSHMNVWDNIAFGLRLKKSGRTEVQDRVKEALKLVKMDAFAKRFPAQLSGGQQQRVALARALVNRPTVLLLDEPLGALDLKLRKEMQVELTNLHLELGVTFIMVTHDQEEALSLSDRIAVMNNGMVEQVGTPEQVYERPITPFVAEFIGDTNLFQGMVETAEPTVVEITTARGLHITTVTTQDWTGSATPDQVMVSIRPEKIHMSLTADRQENCFIGRLKHVMYMGTHTHCVVELLSGDRVIVMQPSDAALLPDPSTPIYIYWDSVDCLALAA